VIKDTLDTGGAHLIEEDIKEKLDEDPFFKLEHLATDKAKADENIPWLDKLEDSQFQKTFDDYGNNRLIRKHFREERKELKALDKEAESKGLALTLLPISEGDTEEADSFVRTKSLLQKKNEHLKIKAASIFSASGEPKDPVKQKLLEKAMKNGMDMRLFGGGTAKKTSKFGGISTKGSSLSSTMPLLAMKPTPKEK
jgi:coiled-coil domain-containing protein 130